MDKNVSSTGMLAGLEQVNLNARTRRQVERQARFAAMIVNMVIGKGFGKSAAKDTRVAH